MEFCSWVRLLLETQTLVPQIEWFSVLLSYIFRIDRHIHTYIHIYLYIFKRLPPPLLFFILNPTVGHGFVGHRCRIPRTTHNYSRMGFCLFHVVPFQHIYIYTWFVLDRWWFPCHTYMIHCRNSTQCGTGNFVRDFFLFRCVGIVPSGIGDIIGGGRIGILDTG